MGSFVWFSYLFPELWSFNCQKLCPLFKFLLMSAKKSKAVIAVDVYESEVLFLLLENGIGYYTVTESLEDIRV